ncbi:hypothetical protein QOZ84_01180 [Romboutsia sedimentorum]|uniref:PepSY domain-containing protein n=1 Tax=Romboutsia sedimentorum TaxID=1368474 RepID=A0ABT7E5D3_9FIRM|nr:hypothetical protein [Romboutsia sedimentorum]MDK2562144.1 hypothetical protein [Romboutsia sedimentorum]
MKFKNIILGTSLLFIMCFIVGYIYIEAGGGTSKNKSEIVLDTFSEDKQDKLITKEEAVQNVKEYLNKSNGYLPPIIEIDNKNENYYIVHAYEIVKNKDESHTATTGWYYVNLYTGEVSDMIN